MSTIVGYDHRKTYFAVQERERRECNIKAKYSFAIWQWLHDVLGICGWRHIQAAATSDVFSYYSLFHLPKMVNHKSTDLWVNLRTVFSLSFFLLLSLFVGTFELSPSRLSFPPFSAYKHGVFRSHFSLEENFLSRSLIIFFFFSSNKFEDKFSSQHFHFRYEICRKSFNRTYILVYYFCGSIKPRKLS